MQNKIKQSETRVLKRSEITPSDYNPRTISDEARKALKKNIKENGIILHFTLIALLMFDWLIPSWHAASFLVSNRRTFIDLKSTAVTGRNRILALISFILSSVILLSSSVNQ